MALISTLLRAAHARGTHAFLALDAIDGLASPAWTRLFYKNIAIMAAYMLLAIGGPGRYSLDNRSA